VLGLALSRALAAVPTLLAAAVLSFVLYSVVPGDAALAAIGDRASADEVLALRHELGLDTPAPLRLTGWLARAAVGDLGRSARTGRPVTHEIADRLGYTLVLAGASVGVAVVLGPLLGAAAAWRGGAFDTALTAVSALLLATPVFAIALPLIAVVSVSWRLLPVAGAESAAHAVLPVVTLALPSTAALVRVSRATFLAAAGAEYVRTARAKGLPELTVALVHVWPNAAPPVLALTGVHLGSLLGGAVVVETLFAWPGLGRLAVSAMLARDFPLAQGVVLTLATGFIAANLAVDVAQRALDPRLRDGVP
jgi:ABC-type dipeptide/oligopeptide/nickel transport system permease component